MTAWSRRDQVAVTRELAVTYTRLYPDNVWGWVVLADRLAALALYDPAKVALRKARALAPATVLPEIWVQWGHLYKAQGAAARATTWYEKAVQVRPETGWLVFLGASLALQGKFKEAKRCYRRAIRSGGPRRDEAYYNLGLIHRAERQYRKALACFEHALECEPKDTLVQAAHADTRWVLDRGR
jgi:tetratricopeptide (TPR) repeat protein